MFYDFFYLEIINDHLFIRKAIRRVEFIQLMKPRIHKERINRKIQIV